MFGTNLILKIEYENHPKTVLFVDRDLSVSHVTPLFSMCLAGSSTRVVALFYCRESTELVSILFVFQL